VAMSGKRVFEELLPFIVYLRMSSTVLNELEMYRSGKLPEGPVFNALRAYSGAALADLEGSLIAEQTRGVALDEKTFKHAASTATALTIASAATTAVAQLLPGPNWKIAVIACAFPAIVYVMAGGLLGFAAARTLPMFGTGMRFATEIKNAELMMKPFEMARALACQERINQVRVARNEAAFMSIRNGFLFIVAALSIALFGVQFASKAGDIERKVWPVLDHRIEAGRTPSAEN
jgi:hypothetical protein